MILFKILRSVSRGGNPGFTTQNENPYQREFFNGFSILEFGLIRNSQIFADCLFEATFLKYPFDCTEDIAANINQLNFWYPNRTVYPRLSVIAQVILASPGSGFSKKSLSKFGFYSQKTTIKTA